MATREVAHFPRAVQPSPLDFPTLFSSLNLAAQACGWGIQRSWPSSASYLAFGLSNVEWPVKPHGHWVRL
jgi:hypothetical protein